MALEYEKSVRCSACGYDLRGHDGEFRCCPECGAVTNASEAPLRPPLRHLWANVALGSAAVGLAAMLGFGMVLVSNDLRVMDLYFGGSPPGRAPIPGAAVFATPGMWLAEFCVYLSIASLGYSLVVVMVAVWRGDARSAALAFAAILGAVIYGFLALNLAFVIAGI